MRFCVPALLVAALVAPAFADVAVGAAAPDFALKDQDGKEVKLSSFRGQKNVVVAFYPKDFTPGCTNEMKCLVKEHRKVTARDTVILAISADPVETHAKFATTLGVQFRLLADTDLAVARTYGVFTASAGGGYAARSAFLVDKDGTVQWLNRSLGVPVNTLEGTDLWAAIEKFCGKLDPVAALASLPPAERDGKTVFVRFVEALLAEDMIALDAVFDPEAGARAGEAPQMQRERRKAMLERYRALADRNDLRTLKFAEVVDLNASRVLTKEAATPEGLVGFGQTVREVASRLADGELLVVGRTSAPRVGETQVLPKDVVLRVRQRGERWTIVEIG